MPRLNKITCSIELGPSNTKLKDYGTRYSDGHVETFITVPDTDLPFSIHLASEGYIAPGLACFVFIDGEYQCNRNRTDLKLPGERVEAHEYETDFRVRQKEEKTSSGGFVVRDWTFAKLNKVAADKAPNVNPQFTSNVGTIEVIVLRCKAAFDDVPPPQTYERRMTQAPVKPKSEPKHKAASKHSAPPAKQPSPLPSELGGLFGLFDGACDVRGADEQAARALMLDGAGDPPGVVINQFTNRAQDGMRDDWYGAQRNDARKEYRSKWDTAGRMGNVEHWQSRVQDGGRPYTVVPKQDISHLQLPPGGAVAGDRLIAALEGMRNSAEDYLLQHEGNYSIDMAPVKHDLGIIRKLLDDLQSPSGMKNFSEWIRDVFEDIEVMRQYTEALQKQYVKVDFRPSLHQLAEMQAHAIRDERLRRHYNDTFEDCGKLSVLFDERIRTFEKYLNEMERPNAVDSAALRDRLNSIRKQRAKLDAIMNSLSPQGQLNQDMRNQYGNRERGQWPGPASVHDWADGTQKHQNGFQEQNRRDDTNRQNDEKPGWQQVGIGSWNPDYQNVGRQNAAGGWRGDASKDQKQPDRQSAKPAASWWVGANHSSKSKYRSKGEQDNAGNNSENGPDQNNGQQNWDNRSNKTMEHNFNDSKSQSKHSAGGWGGNVNGNAEWDNNNGGNNDNSWDHGGGGEADNNTDWKQQGQGDNTWEPPKETSKAKSGWGNDSRRADRTNRSAAVRESEAANPLIKPYWATWNKPIDRNTNTNNSANKPASPRPVYNYPAAPLPAIAEDKAKDRSYGMQASRGADYSHKCRKPIYIDSMEAPYAIFSFKYRSREVLEKILNRTIDDADVESIQEQAERDRLASMPKHKLVEELLKRRASSKSRSAKQPASQGNGELDGWKPDAAQEAGGNAGATQTKGDHEHWAPQSNHSHKTGAEWDNNEVTNNAAGEWGDGGGGDDNGGWNAEGGVAW